MSTAAARAPGAQVVFSESAGPAAARGAAGPARKRDAVEVRR
ncbi:hypothetical protein H4W31_003551 [Plantactinospora soyae]|uniref:Uncharacterized protein n=1 Tax=Plantactinospora soyae TaxID=1544732 RepID=A0A927M9S0_9ACTN|nr:hypothetical protein [Plantactinospora soyae]